MLHYIKDHDLKSTIKYFHLDVFAICLAILLFFGSPLKSLFLTIQGITSDDPLTYTIISLSMTFSTWGILFLALVTIVLTKSYSYETGRKYIQDRLEYGKTYRKLVQFFKEADPHKLDTSIYPADSWKNVKGIVLGSDNGRIISIPTESETNIIVFGPPGSGKTAGIAIINAITFEGSVFAIDIKGDLYNYVHPTTNRPILRFAPDDPNALTISAHFDPLDGIETMTLTQQKFLIENMSTTLIPDEGGDDGNYFTSRARKLFQGIAFLVLEANPDAGFPDIIHAILEGDVFTWVTKSREGSNKAAKEQLDSFYGNSEKNVAGAYDCLASALTHFSSPELDILLARNTDGISVQKLNDGYDIYLQIKQEHLTIFAPLFTLIMQTISNGLMKRPDSSFGGIHNRPVLIIQDEYAALTIPYSLEGQNLATLRSKNVISMLILQNRSQLIAKHNENEANALIGNCNVQIILGSNDIGSSEYYSRMFGKRKVLRKSTSYNSSSTSAASSGHSIQESEEVIFPPERFGALGRDKKAIIHLFGAYAEVDKLNCYTSK